MAEADLKALEKIGVLVDSLAARVQSLEDRLAGLDRQREAIEAAKKSWRAWGSTGLDLVLVNDLCETALVPLSVARVIAAGRRLDPTIRDSGGVQLELVQGSRVVATLPRACMAALPRVLSGAEAAKYLGSAVSVSRVSVGETGEKGIRESPGKPRGVCVPARHSSENLRETTTSAPPSPRTVRDQS